MHTRLPREPVHALTLAVLAAVVTLILIAAGGHRASPPARQAATSWQGLAGTQRPRVAVGQRVIVLLKSPSLADRLGNVGGLADFMAMVSKKGWAAFLPDRTIQATGFAAEGRDAADPERIVVGVDH